MPEWFFTLLASSGGSGIILLVAYLIYRLSSKTNKTTQNNQDSKNINNLNIENNNITTDLLKIQKDLDKANESIANIKKAFSLYVSNNGVDEKTKKAVRSILRENHKND
ncbi:hypothetical protein [Mycoplasmopsis columboralis]|uniref:Uncharacterized protein n=1 Tax=Mycoplasmopsis columboralis TaxID=171282 RepID=A0A449B5V9_9BACT|nr:hypothetical protein [Mycoplasmopsis columboralis]VEU75966.1 Uncharacterised protein [Mycoplasmopsis columboralis]